MHGTVESPWSSDFRHRRLPHNNPLLSGVIEQQSHNQMLSSGLRVNCTTHLLICTGSSRACQQRGHVIGRIPPVRAQAMSSAGTTSETRVAGFAWQLQKLGPPGRVAAGAFTSPFSLYVALALALRGTGKVISQTFIEGVEGAVQLSAAKASAHHPQGLFHACSCHHTPHCTVSHTTASDPGPSQCLPTTNLQPVGHAHQPYTNHSM
jgi:hypothetical protein